MDLGTQLNKRGMTLDALGEWLDSLDHAGRMAAIHNLSAKDQKSLWNKAAAAKPLTMDDMVPADVDDVTEVRHHGRNTLPLTRGFKTFEKRMCRAKDGTGRIFGYNHGITMNWIGPGHFVLVPTRDEPKWLSRGALVVDYLQIPDGEIPHHWPALKRNEEGLQRFVYGGTRDFLRRVSQHVTIGAAYKGDSAMGAYFVLVRQDG